MNYLKFDKTITSHKLLNKFFQSRIKAFFSTTTAENLAFPVFSSFVCGFIVTCGNENQLWLKIFSFAVMVLSWLLGALLSGFLKRFHFAFFAAAFHLLPYIFINPANTNSTQINKILIYLSEFAVINQAKLIAPSGLTPFKFSAGLAAASAILVFAGYVIRKNARSSKEYCRARLSQLSGGSED